MVWLGWRPLGAVLHSLNEPDELSQWLCHDDSTINIVLDSIFIIIIIIYMSLVRSSRRADIRNGSRCEKTDVGHPSESASRTHNDPVHTFYGRSWPAWRSHCDHGWWTTAMLRQLHVSQEHLWCVDSCYNLYRLWRWHNLTINGIGNHWRQTLCLSSMVSYHGTAEKKK